MKRRNLRWVLLPVAALLALWGVSVVFAGRPNPILVAVGPRDDGSPRAPYVALPAADAGVPVVEVEVGRARPIPMKVGRMIECGPGGRGPSDIPEADEAQVAAEEKELRAALEKWLAEQDRRLEVRTTSISTEFSNFLFRPSQRVRVVLRARLVPLGRR